MTDSQFRAVRFNETSCTRQIAYADLEVNDERMIVYDSVRFEDCLFRGPWVACVFDDVTMKETGFMSCGDFIGIKEGTSIAGAVVFIGCSFERCIFERVQIMAHESKIEIMRNLVLDSRNRH